MSLGMPDFHHILVHFSLTSKAATFPPCAMNSRLLLLWCDVSLQDILLAWIEHRKTRGNFLFPYR